MLGQLFSSWNPSRRPASQQAPPLESVTEDTHTRNLLFPDPNILSQAPGQAYPLQTTPDGHNATILGAYDGKKGDFDLESARDVRIIIAQEEVGLQPKSILFDSKPAPAISLTPSAPSTPGHARRSSRGSAVVGIDSRRTSLSSEPPSPSAFGGSAFQRPRRRNTSNASMPNIDENVQGRLTRDSNDELKTCLDCMFGSAALSYKGPTTKLHVLPLENRSNDGYPISGSDGFSSFGRSEGRKRSQLAKSYTVGNTTALGEELGLSKSRLSTREGRRRTILITRTFSVPLPSSDDVPESIHEQVTPTPQNSLPKSGNGYPFPPSEFSGASPRTGQRRSKQRRSPMYAISVIMQLPTSAGTASSSLRPNHSSAGRRPSSSLRGSDSLASSSESDGRSGWTILDPVFDFEQMTASLTTSDADDGVDYVVRHWDVISRTLTSMQFVIQDKIEILLKAAEGPSSPGPSRASFQDGQLRTGPRRIHPLPQNALALDGDVKVLSDRARKRIVRGIEIPRVVTGQARWGVWRDEARQVSRWAGTKEQNFFFFNLLTAFLGTHTEWLALLGPAWYRRRHHEQQKSALNEDQTISSRTVVIANNKTVARRLIFLLSAFLPSSLASRDIGFLGRPSSSASFRAQSQSPPANATVFRQPSLRRTINRRGKPTKGSVHVQGRGRANSPARHDFADDGSRLKGLTSSASSRRSSDAQSIRASGLAIPSTDGGRKSSAATASTITPTSAQPVAHFTLPRASTTSNVDPMDRPDSSDSLVSVNLMQTLRRNNSAQTSNYSNDSQTRWGSLMSNFWSTGNRRGSTTSTSELPSSAEDGLGISGMSEGPHHYRKSSGGNKLQQMVREVSTADGELYAEDLEEQQPTDNDTALPSPLHHPDHNKNSATTPAQAIPERSPIKSPLKLSVNERDGVIDVDVGLSSFGSPMQSPLLAGFASTSSLDASSYGHASVYSGPPIDTDQPVNVAGWLKHFHEDFALQAVRPYEDVEADIKRGMSSEPTPINTASTPALETGPTDKWVDVCSTLIADTQTFSIKRLRLRRCVRLVPAPIQAAVTPGPFATPPARQFHPHPHHHHHSHLTHSHTFPSLPSSSQNLIPSGPVIPMTEHHLEEHFTEEPVMDMDGTLVDAVERVLAHGGASTAPSSVRSHSHSHSHPHSAASSRSSSKKAAKIRVPRQECRKMVLGALEQVARSVQAEGKHRGGSNAAIDSTLREGVRKWLSEVEEGHEAHGTPLAG
ncbi:hypothetical protein EV356DRAFT_438522 [Viridothelium virens]|uniref:Folliculin-interacting protein N-terminal domain-containing protein n=1 Tax=Viridothelium virens TaxID=1048519 RepID=A0A6A6HPT7_VIRVR|nr:hypothetical protein EV356DRAFT_438522 [Viridothelium virens]